MSLIERTPSEQESLSALSRTESSLSGSSEPLGYEGLLLEDDSDVWSSSTGDVLSNWESILSEVGVKGVTDGYTHHRTNEGTPLPSGAVNKQEILRQTHLRRHIEQLREKKLQKEEEVERHRESLGACRENLKSLHAQCMELQIGVSELDQQVREAEGGKGEAGEMGRGEREAGERGGLVARGGLLRAQLGRVLNEIEREEGVERSLVERMKTAELQLSAAIVAYGDYQETEKELTGAEKHTQTVKSLQALQRLQAQSRLRVNAERTKRVQERLMENAIKVQEMQTKEAIEKAQQAQEEGRAFLRKTLKQRKKREAEEGKREREEMERRTRAILNLKKNTESSEGSIQALQMLREVKDRREKACEEERRRQAVLDSKNPDEVVLQEMRAREFTRKKADFEENRKQRQLEIVAKLLEEEKAKKKKEKLASKDHWKGRWLVAGGEKAESKQREFERRSIKRLQKDHNVQNRSGEDGANPLISGNETGEGVGGQECESPEESSGHEGVKNEQVIDIKTGDLDEVLAKPEIDGLWSQRVSDTQQQYSGSESGDREGGGGGRERTTLEQKMLENVVDNLKQTIVRKQVAAGWEFKGRPFTSKPDVAEFRDFVPGEKLKLRLVLTNVTYTVNYCKLVGVSTYLRDFVTVKFNPPGAMSAGLTCHMTVIFEPKLNEDLFGEIELLSQTGPFSIPVRCTTRKCIVRVSGQGDREEEREEGSGEGREEGSGERREVDFRRVCIGETVKRCVTLHNDGALPTDFTVTATTPDAGKLVTSTTPGSTVEGGHVHAVTSETSVMSVMSEVKGDWGAVGRVKDDNRPVSRSASQLPQLELRHPLKVLLEKPDKPVEQPAAPAVSKSAMQQPVLLDRLEQQAEGKGTAVVSDTEGKMSGDEEHREEEELKEMATNITAEERGEAPVIRVGRNQTGYLGGYSSCKVELVFSPLRATPSSQLFTIHFSQPGVPPISIQAKGKGTDLPVYVERDTINLKICTLDRLYQDSIQVFNRGATAQRVSFIFPSEVAPHLEILPPHGLVQRASSFSAQIKFLPLPTIFTDCGKYFDGPENDCLSIPAEVHIVDQVCPVPFTIQARVTESDLKFSSTDIDFGTCTIHESVVASLEITNTSILGQEFGFVHLPECVDVQPNNGFGTLLPRETISVDVIFSASKPHDYCFDLTCLTAINRSFKIACKAKGVLPALKISENVVNFVATPINSSITTRTSISNPKHSRLSSPVIRGAILPQGPKAFEFLVPNGVPLEISPRVGTVGLDETISIELCYTPSLPLSDIKEEALKLATEVAQHEVGGASAVSGEGVGGEGVSGEGMGGEGVGGEGVSGEGVGGESVSGEGVGGEGGASSVAGKDEVKVHLPEEGSEVWQQAVTNLLDRFQNRTDQFSIPCFVSSEAQKSELHPVPYRPEDTLYVEVTIPVIRPVLRLVSNGGSHTLNFETVATGDVHCKMVTVKNVSDHSIELTSSPLDPHGPFDMRNALRPLAPNSSHSLILRFSPQHGGKYHDTMKLFHSKSCGMELRLVGEAVEPHVVLEPDTNKLEFSHTYVGDTSVKKLQLKNTCPLAIRYRLRLHKGEREDGIFRAVNYSGQPVFDCIPFQGRIEPDSTAEIDVLFIPDHQSSLFSDTLHIDINDSPTYTMELSGHAWSSNMYILGGDKPSQLIGGERRLEFESMAALLPQPDGQVELVEPVLIFFQGGSHAEGEGEREGEGAGEMQRQLEIGCINTASLKKNSGDFSVEPLPSSNPLAKTFSFEPTKSSVEAGTTKTLTISFHPPKTDTTHILEASTKITLKGQTTQVRKLLLRAIMSD